MDELQAGIELPFAVLPQPAALFQPRERAFDDPAFGEHDEGVQLIAFDDLYGGLQPLHDAVGEGLAAVATVHQHAFHAYEIRLAAIDGRESAVPVGHLRRGHGHGMRQSLRVHCNVRLNARHLLARIISLLLGAVGVLRALRVHDQEAGRGVAPLFLAGLANGFFLRPAPGRCFPPDQVRSTWRNTNTP